MRAFQAGHVTPLVAGIALLAVLVSCQRAPAPEASSDPRTAAARLQRTNAQLQKQIELAAGKEFYLVLDPANSGLTLMLRGAPLQRFTVLGLQVGHPRVAWRSARDPRHPQSVIWSKGELDPPRQIDQTAGLGVHFPSYSQRLALGRLAASSLFSDLHYKTSPLPVS